MDFAQSGISPGTPDAPVSARNSALDLVVMIVGSDTRNMMRSVTLNAGEESRECMTGGGDGGVDGDDDWL